MPADREDLAGLYALDLLSPEERAAFEARLREDPQLSDAVEACEDALATYALEGTVPAEPEAQTWSAIQARLNLDAPPSTASAPVTPFPLPEASGDEAVPFPSVAAPARSASGFWKVAAALLLIGNLALLLRPGLSPFSETGDTALGVADTGAEASETAVAGEPGENAFAGGDDAAEEPLRLREQLETVREKLERSEALLAGQQGELQRLRAQEATLMQANRAWQDEYQLLWNRFAPLVTAGNGVSRYTVIEGNNPEYLAEGNPPLGPEDYLPQVIRVGGLGGADDVPVPDAPVYTAISPSSTLSFSQAEGLVFSSSGIQGSGNDGGVSPFGIDPESVTLDDTATNTSPLNFSEAQRRGQDLPPAVTTVLGDGDVWMMTHNLPAGRYVIELSSSDGEAPVPPLDFIHDGSNTTSLLHTGQDFTVVTDFVVTNALTGQTVVTGGTQRED